MITEMFDGIRNIMTGPREWREYDTYSVGITSRGTRVLLRSKIYESDKHTYFKIRVNYSSSAPIKCNLSNIEYYTMEEIKRDKLEFMDVIMSELENSEKLFKVYFEDELHKRRKQDPIA